MIILTVVILNKTLFNSVARDTILAYLSEINGFFLSNLTFPF